jgi:hypothetical protein
MELADLTAATFAPFEGSTFRLTPAGGTPFDTRLASVTVGRPGVARDQFALAFVGGPTPPAAQGMFAVEHDSLGTLDLFLVPLGPAGGEQRYEATFS